jgi:glucarate dehydratase
VIIREVVITPVAFADPPLLNVAGVHQPWALRSIIQLVCDDGVVGLGETYGDDTVLARLRAAAPLLVGRSVFDLNGIRLQVAAAVEGAAGATTGATTGASGAGNGDGHAAVGPDPDRLTGVPAASRTVLTTFSPFEVACLDAQGKATGVGVADLLGGAVRPAVPFAAYLFYKWAEHPGQDPDRFGAALDPDGVVAQARAMVDEYGFGSLKLKGGAFPPEAEVEAIRALRAAFPDHPLRLDPNAAWTVQTSVKVADQLTGVLEYLEDPTPGIPGMAEVARAASMPLATNMCVVAFDHLPAAAAERPVGVVLCDHHYWGGLRLCQSLATFCQTFGIGLSMHSNTHLGISLAAMVHLGAATPHLSYACDTHYPWTDDDVVRPGALEFVDGSVPVPDGPGLGVELDPEALARLHQQYLDCGVRRRDDGGYLRRFRPDFHPPRGTW